MDNNNNTTADYFRFNIGAGIHSELAGTHYLYLDGTPIAIFFDFGLAHITDHGLTWGAANDGQEVEVRLAVNRELTGLPTIESVVPPDEEIVWHATMTVGTDRYANWSGTGHPNGSDANGDVSALTPATFTYNGQTISVDALYYGGTLDPAVDTLRFNVDPWSAMGSADLNLYVEASGFRISDPASITSRPEFANHGMEWVDGQKVRAWLTVAETDPPPTLETAVVAVGETLYAEASQVTDPDGRPADADLTYQWVRSDGVDDTEIPGATGQSYTLTADDGGMDIKVRVSYTDDANFPEELTSDAVGPVLDTTVTLVPDDWSLIPSGLSEGDQFRLLFVSSVKRTAQASNIATYNAWIQTQAAAGHTDIQEYSSVFRAVGSTEAVDARDNTVTSGTGVAIYWLDGNKVADNYGDFYDGDWDDETAVKDESGTAVTGASAWTGSKDDGTEFFQDDPPTSRALGNSGNHWVRYGTPDDDSGGPLSRSTANRTDEGRIYGLSGMFQVSANTRPPASSPSAARPR